ncbi:hypothetical protein AB1L42_08620 [Thalassoglobus sp. JC818]|uniref:hypothetical protein n=1 Tax=Thalassoglobus sp. JC818 TaxID=3232136 RepID=UPI00345A2AC6
MATLTMAAATRRIAEKAGCLTLGPTAQLICPHRLSTQAVERFLKHKASYRSDWATPIGVFLGSKVAPILTAAMARNVVSSKRIFRQKARGKNWTIEEIETFPEEYDEFWNRVQPEFSALFDRSRTFVNWRFCEAPVLKYRRFLLRDGDQIQGYLVTRVAEPEELPEGVIVDLFTAPSDENAMAMLLQHGFEQLGPHCDYIEAAASDPRFLKAFRSAGFFPTRTMRPTIVCAHLEDRERLEPLLNSWHFSKADHDWDQVHPL